MFDKLFMRDHFYNRQLFFFNLKNFWRLIFITCNILKKIKFKILKEKGGKKYL
jgi:hypothetical protein